MEFTHTENCVVFLLIATAVPEQNNGLCPKNGHLAGHDYFEKTVWCGVLGQFPDPGREFKSDGVGIFSTLTLMSTEGAANQVSDCGFFLHPGTKNAEIFLL